MAEKYGNSIDTDSLTGIISSEGFNSLSDDTKIKVIDAANKKSERQTGVLGRFFGTITENTALYIAFFYVLFCCYLARQI